ncbi:hypothetical protein FF38_02077 [Lucilia cuprina]|uniref:Uncharacterized protein n=1 Tax=Lucilia cuprina TaxID=7375 RepID=A0A0L0BTJ3_LUCCU|nr:hypothetical protein FF38_02077 [Lucilia cuprina]
MSKNLLLLPSFKVKKKQVHKVREKLTSLGAGIKKSAGGLHCHGADGTINDLCTRVTTTTITKSNENFIHTNRQTSSLCELWRRKLRHLIISSVVDCLRKPRAIKISSVVDCLLMAGLLLPCSTTGNGGGLPQGLASRDEQILVESGDLELRAAEELCLLKA